jgi:hypothetical protein
VKPLASYSTASSASLYTAHYTFIFSPTNGLKANASQAAAIAAAAAATATAVRERLSSITNDDDASTWRTSLYRPTRYLVISVVIDKPPTIGFV